jgi:hypothetical protein
MEQLEMFDFEDTDEGDYDPEGPMGVARTDLVKGTITLNCGIVLPITDGYNSEGLDCSITNAAVVVAGSDDHGWYTIEIVDPHEGTLH